MGELGLDLGLGHARLDKPANPQEAGSGDVRRPGGCSSISSSDLHGAQPVHQPGQPLVIVQRITRAGCRARTAPRGSPPRSPRACARWSSDRHARTRTSAGETAGGNSREPFDAFDAGDLAGLLLGQFVPFPDRDAGRWSRAGTGSRACSPRAPPGTAAGCSPPAPRR